MNLHKCLGGGSLRALRTGLTLLLATAFLAACGGGGGTREFDNETDSGGGIAAIAFTVVDTDSGAVTNSISSTSQSSARAVVSDGAGRPMVNAVVRFQASDPDAIVFSPAATALTDASGVASVAVAPASLSTAGAYTLTASTTLGGQPLAASYNVAVGANQIALAVVDTDSGAVKNSISFTVQSRARALVTDGAGLPVANAVVRFQASDPDAVVFSPATTVLTDAGGLASVAVAPASLSTAGAYTLMASATFGGQPLVANYNVAVDTTQIALGALSAEQAQLSAYGTTLLSVPIQGVPASIPVTVRFTSTCASREPVRATITALATSVDGVARATYVDKGCAGADLVTATVDGTSVSSTATLSVQSPKVANIQFVSASPRVIALRGTGGVQGPGTDVPFPEVSVVRFQVIDESSNPYPVPTDVSLRLSNDTGGLLLDGVSGPLVKRTDAQGYVQVLVQSGSIPTPLWVIATAGSGSEAVVTNSVQLAVSTGQPIQSRFSMSAEYYNLEGWSYDGEMVPVTVRAADSMGNPVPDGTPISFVAGAGLIEANCQTGVATGRPLPGDGVPGVCSVPFYSQSVRPPNGRLQVVAYAVGEEHYEDRNSNNRYDVGEPFLDQGYLFLDRNEDGIYQAGERFIPYLTAQSGICSFNRLTSSVPNTCDGVWGRAHVRDQATFVLSGSVAHFRSSPSFATPNVSNLPPSYALLGPSCSATISFWLQDLNGNPMPYGTQVALNISGAQGLTLVPAGEQKVGSTTAVGGTLHTFVVAAPAANGECLGGGPVVIRATTPKGNVTDLHVRVAPPAVGP